MSPEIFTASLLPSDNQAQSDEVLLEEENFDTPVTVSGLQGVSEISFEDQLDDIQEKLDVISQQIQIIIAEQNKTEDLVEEPVEEPVEEELEEPENEEPEEPEDNELVVQESCLGAININTASKEDLDKITGVGPATAQKIVDARLFYSLDDLLKVSGIGPVTLQKIKDQGCAYVENTIGGGGGGGSAPIVYPKIIISEVQISPIGQRFVELYNPNSAEVDLTDWYLQRKTGSEYASFITKTDFSGKIIKANSYFLISKSDITADITISDLTLTPDNFLALKSPNREIIDEVSWLEVADDLSWCYDFTLCLPTPKAQNIKYVEPPPPTDTDAPQVVFDLASTQTALEFSVNFTITDISTTTTPSGLATFNFQWSDDNGSTWHEKGLQAISDAPLSIGLTEFVSGSDGQVFSFQAMASDVSGNTSNWLPETPISTTISIPVVLKNILINEIQIAGQTVKDEFIELYNPNDIEIDLSNFALKKKTSGGIESNLVSSVNFSGIIPALGYFLIVPQINDDGTPNYTGSAVPDLYYSGKSYSVADNNTILLYDKNDNLQDKVGFGSAVDFETFSAQNPDDGKSISRINSVDTDDNSVDFTVIATPTPKAP